MSPTALALVQDLRLFLPEVILVLTTLLVIVLDVTPVRKSHRALLYLTFCGLLLSGIYLLRHYVDLRESGGRASSSNVLLFGNSIALDPFAVYFKGLFLLVGLLTGVLSIRYKKLNPAGEGEYCVLLLCSTLGLFLMVGSRTLLMAYLGLELVSIPSFVLAGFQRDSRLSNEAALKYTIYGAIASGIMLYGMSLLFGLAGSLDFAAIRHALEGQTELRASPLLLSVSMLMILAGFGYKIACVPFHMWCPDVYEGAPTPITAFLSVGPKAAGFGVILRFFYQSLSTHSGGGDWTPIVDQLQWPIVLSVLSVATMTVGNLAAVAQTSLKRLMAYSSIAHAGYLLMGVVVLSKDGIFAILFYLAVYVFMNFGAFLFVVFLHDLVGSEDIEGCRGLGWRAPFPCIAMAICLFSLTGLPPLGGFIGKFYLFLGVIGRELYWLAILGVLNSVVSLVYYARVVKAMFLENIPRGEAEPLPVPFFYSAAFAVLVAPILLLGVYWAPLVKLARYSSSIFGA
ncbi:MAG: NADH-quinone oxidoreductase subunit N [Planctomycetes bacterium]|nr:NADH-quinone oxidoreductase subunit N [Planctomycetota bacterium]